MVMLQFTILESIWYELQKEGGNLIEIIGHQLSITITITILLYKESRFSLVEVSKLVWPDGRPVF